MSISRFPVPAPGRKDSVRQILHAIALEELSVSHILNAGGKSLQYILDLPEGRDSSSVSAEKALDVSERARELLEAAAENQYLLSGNLREVLAISRENAGFPGVPSAYAANARGTILVTVPAGAVIPLPDSRLLSGGMTLNEAGTVFTVSGPGRYLAAYEVNTVSPVSCGVRLTVNGSPVMASASVPGAPSRHFSSRMLLELPAGAAVSLQMFGGTAAAALTPGGNGASVSLVGLSAASGT